MKQYPSEITIKQRRIKFDFIMKRRKLASELVEKMGESWCIFVCSWNNQRQIASIIFLIKFERESVFIACNRSKMERTACAFRSIKRF